MIISKNAMKWYSQQIWKEREKRDTLERIIGTLNESELNHVDPSKQIIKYNEAENDTLKNYTTSRSKSPSKHRPKNSVRGSIGNYNQRNTSLRETSKLTVKSFSNVDNNENAKLRKVYEERLTKLTIANAKLTEELQRLKGVKKKESTKSIKDEETGSQRINKELTIAIKELLIKSTNEKNETKTFKTLYNEVLQELNNCEEKSKEKIEKLEKEWKCELKKVYHEKESIKTLYNEALNKLEHMKNSNEK